jgi:hypothetical protein
MTPWPATLTLPGQRRQRRPPKKTASYVWLTPVGYRPGLSSVMAARDDRANQPTVPRKGEGHSCYAASIRARHEQQPHPESAVGA